MRVRPYLAAFLLCLAPVAGWSQSASEADLRDLYVKSGLGRHLEQFPKMVQFGFDQQIGSAPNAQDIPKGMATAIRKAISDAYAPDRTREVVLVNLREKLSSADVRTALAWLESPTGAKCTALEEAAGTPDAFVEIQEFAAQLQDAPPSEERVELLRQLDAVAGATELGVALALHTQVAIVLTLMSSLPAEQQIPLDDLLTQAEQAKPALEAAISQQNLLGFLYAYRTLSLDELREYLDFARSPVGVRYHAAALAGVKAAVLQGAINLGRATQQAMEDEKSRIQL